MSNTDGTEEQRPLKHGERLALARHTAASYSRSVVRRWLYLTEAEQAEVLKILDPIIRAGAKK